MKAVRTATLYIAAGLIGGFALAALMGDDSQLRRTDLGIEDAEVERRIALLEARIDQIAAQTSALSDELGELDIMSAEIAVSAVPERVAATTSGPRGGEPDELPAAIAERFEQFRDRRGDSRNLVDRLTAAGFSQTDAQHIETRIEELRVEAMQTRYDAMRSGEPGSVAISMVDGSEALRTELGDSDYERYLDATGRPTRVGVSTVLASSAAQTAGIQSGDQIVSYGGERVFDTRDLNALLLEGAPGEPVIVDLERDGQPIQLVIPRGPLGITSGRGRGGR